MQEINVVVNLRHSEERRPLLIRSAVPGSTAPRSTEVILPGSLAKSLSSIQHSPFAKLKICHQVEFTIMPFYLLPLCVSVCVLVCVWCGVCVCVEIEGLKKGSGFWG